LINFRTINCEQLVHHAQLLCSSLWTSCSIFSESPVSLGSQTIDQNLRKRRPSGARRVGAVRFIGPGAPGKRGFPQIRWMKLWTSCPSMAARPPVRGFPLFVHFLS
jgi:hypothetical protein